MHKTSTLLYFLFQKKKLKMRFLSKQNAIYQLFFSKKRAKGENVFIQREVLVTLY